MRVRGREKSGLLALRKVWLLLYCRLTHNPQVCGQSARVGLSDLYGVLVYVGTCDQRTQAQTFEHCVGSCAGGSHTLCCLLCIGGAMLRRATLRSRDALKLF